MAAELSETENSGSDPELSRSENSDEIQLHEYQALFDAVSRGDWHETEKFLTLHPNAITAMEGWGTALHYAVLFGHEQIVEELVKLTREEDLEIRGREGWTALAHAARDNIKMVRCMVAKNKKSLGIAEDYKRTPILIAAQYDRWDIVRYLYSVTPPEDLMPDKGHYGSELVSYCLYAKQFDIAWESLQRCPLLACTVGIKRSPLHLLMRPLHSQVGLPLNFGNGGSIIVSNIFSLLLLPSNLSILHVASTNVTFQVVQIR